MISGNHNVRVCQELCASLFSCSGIEWYPLESEKTMFEERVMSCNLILGPTPANSGSVDKVATREAAVNSNEIVGRAAAKTLKLRCKIKQKSDA